LKLLGTIFITFLFVIGCSNSKQNLIVVENDYEVDLTKIDSVRENLNGFWILENKAESNEIVWLKFPKNSDLTSWNIIGYDKENEKTKQIDYNSSAPFIKLIKHNKKIEIEFTTLSNRDTVKIEKLTKTKLKISGTTYLKHKGYKFLKD